MKLVTIKHQDRRKVGVIQSGTESVWLLEAVLGLPVDDMLSVLPDIEDVKKKVAAFTGDGIALSSVRIEAPIPRPARNVFCVGKN